MNAMRIRVKTIAGGEQWTTAIAMNDQWAMHPMTTIDGESNALFSVTHRPTGYCISNTGFPKAAARRLFDALKEIDCATTDPVQAFADLKSKGVQAIVDSVRGERGSRNRRVN